MYTEQPHFAPYRMQLSAIQITLDAFTLLQMSHGRMCTHVCLNMPAGLETNGLMKRHATK